MAGNGLLNPMIYGVHYVVKPTLLPWLIAAIAWAAGQNANWWWPGPDVEFEYWPESATRAETLDAFQEAFASVGYAICQGADFEPGFEKVALFADEKNCPMHAARQLPNGRWTSKLGILEDIEHALLDLEGSDYGKVVVLMKRPALT